MGCILALLRMLDQNGAGIDVSPEAGIRPGGVHGVPAMQPGLPLSDRYGGMRRFVLRKDQAGLVERLARPGRLRLRRTDGEEDPPTVRWDDGQPWRFSLDIRAELGGSAGLGGVHFAAVNTAWTFLNRWFRSPAC